MAKKTRSRGLDYTAENIGAALGQFAGRLDAWKRQRAALGAELQRVMKVAQHMLADMGPFAVKPRTTNPRQRRGGRPKGFQVSPETRAKLKSAWERRRAAAKDQTKPKDQRATIRKATGKKFSNRQRGKG